ncbi:tRNA (adenosine(37)-N6)-threonylcarbamoyltransferase complex dimerization subunit type 1 TsaB [Epidermidibacterium keratini]|uniref:tRNA (Adenosine(37)-N6)-threonylcarbamoyltransferase complex dimerization subunit type 1 TsaB n=1 Tax=Epidermidibacterium keratini TaxID=1891644 RepID=A0A7L4YR64_9ACTN|nr:tRNA (adenosine(37)-N6)-threonylcarbamoyltransferase complex dimerization subunit type 1 TsaB [Epidermidibacterium keratini]QHC01433.1 tRNA (adenosine(37)-N6)-threonylcarbamoyltransferase complex dimerization subunit type 1 TsaB [Epidermidibacterium keratini]
MIVLAIDSATARLVAGVVDIAASGAVRELSAVTDEGSRRHAEVLTPAIHEALQTASAAPEGIVVGLGPGPFTGLRVGIVTAAAFGDALGIPVWGIGTHLAIADGQADALVISDARRREVYYSTYDQAGVQSSLGVAPLAEVPIGAARTVLHPGVAAYADQLAALGLPTDEAFPSAASLARAAHREGLIGGASSPLTPIYLRTPDAAEPAARPPLDLVWPAEQP